MVAAKRIFLISAVFLLFLILLGICLFLILLPAWLEKSVVPNLVEKAGVESFSWQVRHVGMTGADFGRIRIGGADTDTIEIDSVLIDYTLAGIFNRRIDTVRISGVKVRFQIQDGKPVIPGLEALMQGRDEKKGKKEKTEGNIDVEAVSLPIGIGEVEIKNAVLEGAWKGRIIRFPLEINVSGISGKPEEINANIRVYPWGEKITASVRADLTRHYALVQCESDGFDLGGIPSWLITSPLRFSGKLNFSARLRLFANPFHVSDIDVNLLLHQFTARSGNIQVENAGEENRPGQLSLTGDSIEQMRLKAANLAVVAPILMELTDLEGLIQIEPDRVHTSLDFDTRLNLPMLDLSPDIEHSWKLSASLSELSAWKFQLAGGSLGKQGESDETVRFRIRTGQADIRSAISKISVEGSGNLRAGQAEISGRVLKTHLEARSLTVDFPELLFKAALDPEGVERGGGEKKTVAPITFFLRLPNVSARAVSERFEARQISLNGEIASPFSSDPRVTGQVKVTGAKASDTLFSVGADDIQMTFPFAWPPSKTSPSGSFSIKNISQRKKNIATISGTLRQEGMGATLNAKIDNRLISRLDANVGAAFAFISDGFEGRIDWEIPRFHTGENLNLGQFFPKASGVFLNGSLEADGKVIFSPGVNPSASMKVSIADTSASLTGAGLVVEGIDLDIQLRDLPEMRSLPHQKLRFDSLQIGNVKIENGTVVFQIEAADKIFIEKSHFNWCGGNVDTNAALIGLPELDVELILYCDRLALSRVLQQLGGVKGEGEGAVNGRIPLSHKNGQLTFQDGFLYSTPGRGGVIKLSGTDSLLAGVPEGTQQFTQIDLAREALKHYDYDWARVNVTTREGNLQLGLQLDGQPVDPLPFKYDTTFGGFARVEVGSPGSRFQGIRLDVNFNLPLDKVLKYGKGLKDLF